MAKFSVLSFIFKLQLQKGSVDVELSISKFSNFEDISSSDESINVLSVLLESLVLLLFNTSVLTSDVVFQSLNEDKI